MYMVYFKTTNIGIFAGIEYKKPWWVIFEWLKVYTIFTYFKILSVKLVGYITFEVFINSCKGTKTKSHEKNTSILK